MAARVTRAGAWAVVITAAAVALAACGSSGTSTTNTVVEVPESAATTASSSTPASSKTSSASSPSKAAPPATTAVSVPGCRSVPQPAPRTGEQAPKATTQLDPAHIYTVRLTTNCGPIVIALAVREAPKTTSSFANLVQTGYYNDLTFHRVVPGFVIQGGDPNGDGSGGPSWRLVELPPKSLRYTKGVVAMAKTPSAPAGSSGSQFFIVTGASAGLPPEYALVGHVVGSERAVESIARVPTETAAGGGQESKPRAPMVIEHAALSTH
jgi:peptidyl-prolyl cis-trans isomerase B (cyclophilin B)